MHSAWRSPRVARMAGTHPPPGQVRAPQPAQPTKFPAGPGWSHRGCAVSQFGLGARCHQGFSGLTGLFKAGAPMSPDSYAAVRGKSIIDLVRDDLDTLQRIDMSKSDKMKLTPGRRCSARPAQSSHPGSATWSWARCSARRRRMSARLAHDEQSRSLHGSRPDIAIVSASSKQNDTWSNSRSDRPAQRM